MTDKRAAVQRIKESSQQLMVSNACERALKDGSDQALTQALITAREIGTTAVVCNTANRALGFED